MRANRELHTFSDPLYATLSFEKGLGTEAIATKTGPQKEVSALMLGALVATVTLNNGTLVETTQTGLE